MRASIFVALLSWGGAAHADVFGNDRLTLTCEGAAVVDTPCQIEIGPGSAGGGTPVRFTTQPTRYAHLLKQGIEKATEEQSLLRTLALDKCHPDADSMGDIFQLCVPAGSSTSVVLFVRGLCDRCGFEPAVLKKRAAPR